MTNVRKIHVLAATAGAAGVLLSGSVAVAEAGADARLQRAGSLASATPTARPAVSTPIFIAGSYHGRRPRDIEISGDGGDIVTGLHWSRWAATRATGKGTSNIQGCVPNCAAGTETPVTTWITLRDPRHGYFTKLIERRDGHTETFTYTPGHLPDNWPGDAS
jgi:hypothetical protein